MDLIRFLHETRTILTDVESRMSAARVRSIRASLDHGEEGIALNDFVAALVANDVPVTAAQRDILYELVAYFGRLDEETQHHLPHLTDWALNWLTVLDEP